jgi:hypothetical protein
MPSVVWGSWRCGLCAARFSPVVGECSGATELRTQHGFRSLDAVQLAAVLGGVPNGVARRVRRAFSGRNELLSVGDF